MPELVKKLVGQFDNVLCDLERISGSLAKPEKMGCDLGRVTDILGKLVGPEDAQDALNAQQMEEIVMCLRIDPGNSQGRIAVMAVKVCSKYILAPIPMHGKSPCSLQVTFLSLVGPDYPLLILSCVDGAETLECAF
jgi:hypothetical protein